MISNYFGSSSGKSNQSNQTCSLEVNKNCTQTEVPSRINKDELFLKYEDMSSVLFSHKCTINSLETIRVPEKTNSGTFKYFKCHQRSFFVLGPLH